MPLTRILIVDDESPVRRGLAMRLAAETDLAIVGEASDGLHGIDSARALKPDLVLLDVRMPGLDGISAGALIVAQNPGVRVIFLTMHDDAHVRREAARIGAAVVGKQMVEEELVAVIRALTQRHRPASDVEAP